MSTTAGKRSRKDLKCTADASAHQKGFIADLKQRVFENGEAFVVAQADTPHEIFHAMDIPLVTNQWWSAYISAKQLSARYFDVLSATGYPENTCRYCALGLACTLANDPETAPWGGLPKPAMLVARLTCDCIQRVFSRWADALDSEFFAFEAPAWRNKEPRWFEQSRTNWEEVYEPERIGLLVSEIEQLIAMLEERTGKRFDHDTFAAMMDRINVQESALSDAAEIIATARPCPVSIGEQMTNTMIPQWHRGSDWAVAHAERFRDEVAERAAAGIGCSGNEKLRLMWIGAGVWHDPGFYQVLEERHGAVFVWSMYLPFAGPQYVRQLKGRPLEALASRICSMNEVLHLPPWMNSWMSSEAARFGIDAAVILRPSGNRLSQSGINFVARGLEEQGKPVLILDADMVNASNWNHERMVGLVESFLAERGLT